MSQRIIFAWVWGLVVCFLVVHNVYLWFGKGLAPDTDILALLPIEERDPVLQRAFARMVDSGQQRLIATFAIWLLPPYGVGAGSAITEG